MNAVQKAFVKHDAQQCGFCTPGFVVACTGFFNKHPNPTPEDPPAMKPMRPKEGTGMPNRGLTKEEVDKIVAFLETLR